MKLKKRIGTVIVNAPVGSGKSVLLGIIRDALKEKYGSGVLVIEDRPLQEPLTNKNKDWEHEMLKDTVWILTETNEL